MIRKLRNNLLLLAASSLVSVLLIEAGVRFAAPQQAVPEWYAQDRALGHVLKADFHQRYEFEGSGFTMDVRTNSAGLRDLEQDYAIPAPGKTILLIGDSFVFGYGVNVEDRIDAYLRAKFASDGTPVRVIDAGVPGWGTLQEVKYAESKLSFFAPDVIVLVYCGNDQQDDRGVLNGTTVFREDGLFSFPGKRWLRVHSHLYRLAFYATSAWRQAAGARMMARNQPAARVDAQSAAVLTDQDWTRTGELIRGLADAFRRQNPNGVLYLTATAPEDPNLSQHLARIADGVTIRYVDLAERVNAIPPAERRLPFDPHWSARMHALMGEGIYGAIRAGRGGGPTSPGH